MSRNRNLAVNRQAYFNYEVLEKYEAGLILTGTEIKSVRLGRIDLRGSYVRTEKNELWLQGAHIARYDAAGGSNHDPKQPRKLLMHKTEILDLADTVAQKGLTVVPLRLYLKRQKAKLELGLVRGKKRHDKRRTIINRERERQAQRALRHGI
ncbi:SsrA-binding protein SmpB [SAR202 cluster bacterium AC-409-J13_OGT_754m]|nr:SsrA-binding protein SmpB [SAR202 cluster bacterium AC-409-J13_OGT_754m]